MDEGSLKKALQSYQNAIRCSDFSIAHRGAPLQFPEHTRESYEAAARMGAGICECDVTFTKDRVLVCRHSQCDLHTTTNILAIPELAAKCSQPFTPAQFDANGKLIKEASAKCCCTDITAEEFKRLKGKMDGYNPYATTVEEYLKGTPDWRTDLYNARGTVMTHAESIELFKQLGMKMTPELKAPQVRMPYEDDYSQEDFAQQMIDEYKASGVEPNQVFAQSFNLADILYWIQHESSFGRQGVYLGGPYNEAGFDNQDPNTWGTNLQDLADQGVNIVAPPIWVLLTLNDRNQIVPSAYALAANTAGLGIITWTFERSDLRQGGHNQSYYRTISGVIDNEGDKMAVLDVLAQKVGVIGVFSDWPAAVTYYANCMGIGLRD